MSLIAIQAISGGIAIGALILTLLASLGFYFSMKIDTAMLGMIALGTGVTTLVIFVFSGSVWLVALFMANQAL